MTRLGGKAAILTGAAQGIGQGIALRLMNYPALEKPLIARIRQGRLETLADLAGVAAFLASDDVDYVTATTTVVDGRLLWNYAEQ